MSEVGIARTLSEAAKEAVAQDKDVLFRSADSKVAVHGPLESNLCAVVFSGEGHEAARDAAGQKGILEYAGVRYKAIGRISDVADGKSVLLVARSVKVK